MEVRDKKRYSVGVEFLPDMDKGPWFNPQSREGRILMGSYRLALEVQLQEYASGLSGDHQLFQYPGKTIPCFGAINGNAGSL